MGGGGWLGEGGGPSLCVSVNSLYLNDLAQDIILFISEEGVRDTVETSCGQALIYITSVPICKSFLCFRIQRGGARRGWGWVETGEKTRKFA